MLDTQMLIGSNFVAGTDAPEPVINPKTEETIVTLPDASPAQVDAAVDAAAKSFQNWSRTTPAERSGLLLKLADAIERSAEAFATLEALNCGKPRIRVLQDEIPGVVDCFRFRNKSIFCHCIGSCIFNPHPVQKLYSGCINL